RFRAVVEAIGEGLAAQKAAGLTLEITHVRKVKVKEKDPKTNKIVEVEKEEFLPIEVIEAEHPEIHKTDEDRKKLQRFTLTTREEPTIVLKPATEPVFDRGTPPRVEVEWQLDAGTLAPSAPAKHPPDPT